MKRRGIIYAMVAMLLLAPVHAYADGKKMTGGILILSGSVLMLSAFNYQGDQCPSGYSTNTIQGATTQCVYVSNTPPYNSDVKDATNKVTLKRPSLMWTGVGAVGAGVVLLMLPKGAARLAPSISITPRGWSVSKTFGFANRR